MTKKFKFLENNDIHIMYGTDNKQNLKQPEFDDIIKVLEMGAKKYSPNGWLEPEGPGTSHKEMHASLFRHLAASSAGIEKDKESGLDHLLHVACRALMLYCRKQRSIRNPKDD